MSPAHHTITVPTFVPDPSTTEGATSLRASQSAVERRRAALKRFAAERPALTERLDAARKRLDALASRRDLADDRAEQKALAAPLRKAEVEAEQLGSKLAELDGRIERHRAGLVDDVRQFDDELHVFTGTVRMHQGDVRVYAAGVLRDSFMGAPNACGFRDALRIAQVAQQGAHDSELGHVLASIVIPDPAHFSAPFVTAGRVSVPAGGVEGLADGWQDVPALVDLHQAAAGPRLLLAAAMAFRAEIERELNPPKPKATSSGYEVRGAGRNFEPRAASPGASSLRPSTAAHGAALDSEMAGAVAHLVAPFGSGREPQAPMQM